MKPFLSVVISTVGMLVKVYEDRFRSLTSHRSIFFIGAMDDGGGAMISWTVLSLLHTLNLRARRTIRCVLWSCEEFGGVGASQYFKAHESEVSIMSIVMESDLGVFHPRGLQFRGNNEARQVNLLSDTSIRSSIERLFFHSLHCIDHRIDFSTISIDQCYSSRSRW